MSTAEFSISLAAQQAKKVAPVIAQLQHKEKRNVLLAVAEQLREREEAVLSANAIDMQNAKDSGLDAAMCDRLLLDPQRLESLAQAVEVIANQPDPVGSMSASETMASGIQVAKMRIPLGVIAMIYESRPNVTIDAAALCFKAGNAVILRGGKEALHSNLALAECFHAALASFDLPDQAVTVIPDPDRAIMNELLTLNDSIDLVIPRGGEGLIRFVSEHSRIPVIQHFNGVCHLFVDRDADLSKALNILENGKTQRVGVCNALETLLVDKAIAAEFLPRVQALFAQHSVRVHACEQSLPYFPEAEAATEHDWHAEYLAMEIAVRVVDDMQAAIAHISTYGSGHTEVIVTEHLSRAQQFIRVVDSSVVMVNASSRFSDGGELGLGAEIGISTSKLHAYGPMGAASLTTEKFVVTGSGHIRA
ncbi:glutamate-5-semialdehyde dehydrogenase [Alteromonas sp. ASW11-36]|uniref:Gamma-glutamyl phosphate reductase n=1 Tax=Alteromonas arenosi TaxID=3055817 RepID=A0ABT7T0U3_9ALTE|nr:glutamate-5-semialdehyde dehydrogenase [Alteromonas sp. ASW11-36]MDM7862005.1 glutamate-5-semialdehyde dehydrogenase [Alteromonas sp. ASW11-36]